MDNYPSSKATHANAIPTLKRQVRELCEKHGHLVILDHVRAALALRLVELGNK